MLQIERDPTLSIQYIKASPIGYNKIVYLPLLSGVIIIMFFAIFGMSGMPGTISTTVLILLALIALACFVAVFLIAQ